MQGTLTLVHRHTCAVAEICCLSVEAVGDMYLPVAGADDAGVKVETRSVYS